MGWLRDQRLYRVAALVWMAVIFLLSSQSHLPAPLTFPGEDWLMHFLFFGVLGMLVARAFYGPQFRNRRRRVLWVTLFVAAYGVSDEFHQLFVPGRDASIADAIADTAGGLVAALLTPPLQKGDRPLFLSR